MDSCVILTVDFVEKALAPQSTNSWFFTDALVEGFQLKVSRRGKKTFWLRERAIMGKDRKRTSKKLGFHPAMTVREARDKALCLKMQTRSQARSQVSTKTSGKRIAHANPIEKPLVKRILDYLRVSPLEIRCSLATSMHCLSLWFLLSEITKAEVCRLQWKNLDLDAGICVVGDRSMKLPPEAIQLLVIRKASGTSAQPYIFPGLTKEGHIRFPSKLLVSTLRHSNASSDISERLSRTRGSLDGRYGDTACGGISFRLPA